MILILEYPPIHELGLYSNPVSIEQGNFKRPKKKKNKMKMNVPIVCGACLLLIKRRLHSDRKIAREGLWGARWDPQSYSQ